MNQAEVQDNILVLSVFYELIVEGNAEERLKFILLRILHGATIEHFFSCSCRYQTSRKGGDNITWILNEAIPVKPDVMNHMGWVSSSLGPRPKPTLVWIAFSIGCVILEAIYAQDERSGNETSYSFSFCDVSVIEGEC